jgi:hypothetical protein
LPDVYIDKYFPPPPLFLGWLPTRFFTHSVARHIVKKPCYVFFGGRVVAAPISTRRENTLGMKDEMEGSIWIQYKDAADTHRKK